MCKIGLADEALNYNTLIYWVEGSGQYNCTTTRSCIIGPYYQAQRVGFNRKRQQARLHSMFRFG